jgi:L-asparagine transporter-like permease
MIPMNESILPHESKKFVQILGKVALAWYAFGVITHIGAPDQILVFTQIFLFSFLDVVFLVLLFWTIFFTPEELKTQRSTKIRIMVFSFFKLVCLGFLAITLKRLRNASVLTLVMGVCFIWIGPLISGVFLKYSSNLRK